MPKIPVLNTKKLMQILEKKGFLLDHVTGSHYIYRDVNKRRVTLPFHKKDLPKGTLYSIIKQAGLEKSDLI